MSNEYDDERPTSISVSKTTAKIFDSLKSRKDLPSMEAVVQWLILNLGEGALAEVKEITDFLHFYPPFKNETELLEHLIPVVSEEREDYVCEQIAREFIAEKPTADPKMDEGKHEDILAEKIREYAEHKDKERRKEGLSEMYEPFFSRHYTGSFEEKVIKIMTSIEAEEKTGE